MPRPLPTLAMLAVFVLAVPAATAGTADVRTAGTRVTVPVRSLQELRYSRLVRQTWDVSCGAAALSTLLTYHMNRPVDELTVATWILRGVDPQRVRERGGFSLLDLKRFAEALGYRAEGYGDMTLTELIELRSPAIVPVSIHGLDHFVVMRGVLADRVLLGDPAFGNITMPQQQFAKLWKGGIAFFVFDGDGIEPSAHLLTPEIADLRVPDLPAVGRLLRGAGPAPLTRGHPAVP